MTRESRHGTDPSPAAGEASSEAGSSPSARARGGRVLHVARRGAVLEVTLDRPKANAIDGATSRRMGELFAGFRDDPALRVAIVTGAGDRFFSAGWDLKGAAEGEPPDTDYGAGGFGGLQELPGLTKPVIAAVNGHGRRGRVGARDLLRPHPRRRAPPASRCRRSTSGCSPMRRASSCTGASPSTWPWTSC